ncbi:MAG: hypothetical protein UX10_C0024G0006 [Candidatus Magasanikbacteria bacterium GW2011_GWA2_45_39]|uniref:Rod shape-determining protein MreD n=2 Tax=Candidatus Magasanikiibacteriota TaxID=1752731 RepID=A0A0G1MZ20_9BACT|nr:MAG: hypothetical protein UX10_C0024G0006 [Candidatus Magasanikbacteria bacterium GW2011_GWA2_45_39]KKU13494.1 MAG: hypothetical protein UX20_C0020G0023 [Candidatus Magasanikbacteria bacterium GW2011_GWC2_45_8]HBW73917.1 hypothetical protein [Candidatus Magasanikbacteria bacterium]
MRHTLFQAFFLSFILIIAQQISSVLFAWHIIPLTEISLVILVFIIALGTENKLILLTACFTGLLLDLWSPSGFGTIALALTLTLSISIEIFHRALTNKSLSALLILGVTATFTYRIIIFLINSTQFLKNPESVWKALLDSMMKGGVQAVTHSMFLLILFVGSRLVSKRLHPHYVHSS